MRLQRAARKFVDIPARFYDRSPARREIVVPSMDVALLPPGTKPTFTTTWTPVPMVNRRGTIYLVGPDAGGPAAGVTVPIFTIPTTGVDLYIRATDTLESDPTYSEQITLF